MSKFQGVQNISRATKFLDIKNVRGNKLFRDQTLFRGQAILYQQFSDIKIFCGSRNVGGQQNPNIKVN
jgi:hypothetical protein